MDVEMELLVMQLVSGIEEFVNSKEFKIQTIKKGVKATLQQKLEEQKITSTEYQSALEILENYKFELR